MPEQVTAEFREDEVALAGGGAVPEAARRIGVTERTFYCRRSQNGGLRSDLARPLKRAVADLTLENQILREPSGGFF